jgi:elongation factor G
MSKGAKPERPILAVSFPLHGAQIVVKGMDELHLLAVCDAICKGANQFVDLEPTVILQETIRKAAEGEGKYIRHTGGFGNYGHVRLLLEPKGEEFEFQNELPVAMLPGEFAAAAEMGIRQAAFAGVLHGHEVTDVKVTLIGGSFHEIDSNPMAFQIAGSMAFKEAAKKASPVVLEPMMMVKFMVDLASVQETVGELNARGGRIESMEPHAASLEISAFVPLREMLSSSKYGRPDYPMEFARYEQMSFPPDKFGEDGAGVTANLPKFPHPGRRAAAVQPDIAFD